MKITTPYLTFTYSRPYTPFIPKETTLLKMIKASVTGVDNKKKKNLTKIQKKSTIRLKLLLLLLKVKNSPMLPNFSSIQEIDLSTAFFNPSLADLSLILALNNILKLILEKKINPQECRTA